MTIWNVYPMYYRNSQGDTMKYVVLPYDLKGVISTHFKYYNILNFIQFLKNSRFTEKAAKTYAEKKNKQHDIEW